MLLKQVASMMVCALMLLALTPPGVSAQTQAQPKAAAVERRSLSVSGAETRSSLKALFAESASRIGTGRLTGLDFKRLEKMQQEEDTQPAQNEKWSKRKKVLMIIAIIGAGALTAWAIANSVENPRSFCDTAPWDPDCIP